jgi:hypothetical protein
VIVPLSSTKHRADSRDELTKAVGLGDVVVRADLEHQHHVDLLTLRAHDDDRHTARRSNRSTDVESGHLGQHEVEEHDVERVVREECECLLPVARDRDFESFAAESNRERVDERFLVFDDEDTHAMFAWLLLRHCWLSGSSKVKVEPSPSRESTSTVPP